MDELYYRLDALAFYAPSALQHFAFQSGMNWCRNSPSANLREKVKDSVHLLEHVGYMEKDEYFGKVTLSILLERKFGDN
jgi:hypothetical protein